MLWKTFALSAVFAVTASVGWAAPPSFDVKLNEPPDRPADTIRWPITVGVPFADGAIADDTPLALTDASGRPAPVQTKTIGEWREGAKTPQWILLDFQAALPQAETPVFHVAAGQNPAATPSPIQIKQTAEVITVDTGAVAFTVNRQHFSLFESLWVPGGSEVLKGASIYWIRENGQRYETKPYGQPTVVVETAGPMRAVIRAEGWYAPVESGLGGKPEMMKYQVRIEAFAGLPYVRIYHTFIWTADDTIKMKEWGISFRLAEPAEQGKIGLEGGSVIARALTDKTALEGVQLKYSKVPRLAGWAQAGDFGVALTDMSMQLPKAWAVYPDHIDVQLWAPQAGVLSMNENDRMPFKVNEAQKEWTTSGIQHTSPQGVAKTHELWVWPIGPKSPPASVVNDYVQRPPIAMADAAYQCSTDVLQGLRAASDTPKEYQWMEEALSAMFDDIATPEDWIKDFDMFNFGSVHLFSPAGWRGFDNNGYNWSQTPWRFFYRTGERKYFMHGVRNARHVMDVTVCNYANNDGPDEHMKRVGYSYMYSPLPWGWGPFGDNFNCHPQYLMYYYDLTGYERAADVLNLMADAGNGGPPNPAQYPTVSRSQYGVIDPKCVYYWFTGQETYARQALAWARLAMSRRDAQGQFTNNNFWYFFHRGLWDTWRITGARDVLDSLVSLVKAFAQPPANSLDAPHGDRNSMLDFYAAWRTSGNEHYLDYPIHRIMDELHAVQIAGRAKPWIGGRGYAAMERPEYMPFLDSVPELLGAWHDIGFKALPKWPGNYPLIGSHPVNEGNFKSGLTLYVKKASGAPGTLALMFQVTNLTSFEAIDQGRKKMEARITAPDGTKRLVTATPIYQPLTTEFDPFRQPAPILFDAAAPAGVYRVEILGEQQLFWLAPRTDLPGLVVEIPDQKVSYKFREEPARLWFRLQPGLQSVRLNYSGPIRRNTIRPLRITDLDDATLGFMPLDAATLSVSIPPKAQDKPLSLAAGMNDWTPWDMNLPAVSVEGAQPYFSVQPDQWFLPVKGKP